MADYNLIATLGSTQKTSGKIYGGKTSARNVNATTPYLQVLQNTLSDSSANRKAKNSVSLGNPYVSDPRENILKGDANNDGVVDKNDLALLQRNLIGLGTIKNFRAADMDGDGKITVTDVSQLSLALQEEKTPVSTIKGDVNGDGKVDVVGDAATINNYVNGYITKNDFLYDNADVTGDGTVDLVDAKKIEAYYNGEINSLDDTWTWQATALQKLPVYTDENLTVRSGNEEVWANDKVTVLKANANAYFIRYPVKNGYKERWVSKAIFEKPQPSPLPEKLQNLIDKWEGKIWQDETTGKGNFQCKDFAAYIFRQMYGVWYIGSTQSKSDGNNYKISINNPPKVGTRDEIKNLTANSAKNLFANAKAGDFVQMRRSGTGGSHSAIVGEVTNEGVWFFEANAPDSNGGGYVYNKVKYQFHSWENLAQKNSAMSVYYAK